MIYHQGSTDTRFIQLIGEKIIRLFDPATCHPSPIMLARYWEVGKILVGPRRWKNPAHNSTRGPIVSLPALSGLLQYEYQLPGNWSARNLRHMHEFALAWPDYYRRENILSFLSWQHHKVLLKKIEDPHARLLWVHRCIVNKWSSRELASHLDSSLHFPRP